MSLPRPPEVFMSLPSPTLPLLPTHFPRPIPLSSIMCMGLMVCGSEGTLPADIMKTSFNSRLSNGAKVFLVFVIIISITNAIYFIIYGNRFYYLATALGLPLIGYNVYKNGFFRRKLKSDESFDKTANDLSIIGIILCVTAIVVDWSQ